MTITLNVTGTPAPQGSKTHVGFGRMIESSKAVAPWRAAIKAEITRAAHGGQHQLIDGPVWAEIAFRMPRPKAHWRVGRFAGQVKDGFKTAEPDAYPDLDKLVRSTLDGLTATSAVIQGRRRYGQDGHLKDDGQVVRLTAFKRYVQAGEEPGALITLRAAQQSA